MVLTKQRSLLQTLRLWSLAKAKKPKNAQEKKAEKETTNRNKKKEKNPKKNARKSDLIPKYIVFI
jgi:hypothetical protein